MPIRDETGADHAAVARLHRLAFGGDGEARLVEALRRSGAAAVSVVAECGGGFIVGHVLLSRLASTPGALALARVGGWAAVFVLGAPAFYGRFGFEAETARGYASQHAGEYFMAVRLGPAPLPGAGAVVYPEPFAAVG